VTASHAGLPYPRRIFAVFAVSAGSMTLMIDASIANIALPTIATALRVEASDAVLVVTAYQLILAMTLMPLAAVGQRIGYRRLYGAGLVLHSLAALLCLRADSLPALLVARSLQALGTASAMSVAFGMVRAIYPWDQLGKGMAINTIANAGGTALAPVVGGLVLSAFEWQWVFAAAVPFSILCLLFSRNLPDPEPQDAPFDLRGAALCAATFGVLVTGLQLTSHAVAPWLAFATLGAGGAIAWLFVRHELRVPAPVLPIDLLAQARLSIALLANFSAVIGSMIVLVFVPFLLQHAFAMSPAQVGGMMASYALASVMVAPVSGYLSDRIPVVYLCTSGMAVAALGLILLANLPAEAARGEIVWRLWLAGAGFGLFFSPNARLIIAGAPRERAASAGSMVTTVRMLGQAIGATLVAGMLAMGLGDSAVPLLCSFALVALAGFASAINLRRRG